MTDTCRDCHQPILWVTSMSGTRYPIDARPDFSRGQFFLAAGTDKQRLAIPVGWLGEHRRKVEENGLLLFANHMLTCPVRQDRRAMARQTKEAA